MHRSGTSMLTQWLSACGLNVGERLMGEGAANKFGHFEDYDFFHFHEEILKANGCTYVTSLGQQLTLSDKLVKKAEKILDDRKNLPQWGWKEPRTCLFMPLWDKLLPDAFGIVIYRHYDEVVDSLYRRESSWKKPVKKVLIPARIIELISYRINKTYHYNRFLEAWIRYNNDLIAYVQKRKGSKKTLIFSVGDLLKDFDLIYNTITSDWGFKLKKVSMESVFSKESMKGRNAQVFKYESSLQKKADELLERMEALKTSVEQPWV